jgi:hypothetical protein
MVVRSSARCQGIRRPSGLSAQTMSKRISSRMHKVVTASSRRMHSDLDPSLTSTYKTPHHASGSAKRAGCFSFSKPCGDITCRGQIAAWSRAIWTAGTALRAASCMV